MHFARGMGLAVAVCTLFSLAGCGGSDLPLVKVSGKVTFDGGPPPKSGTIQFMQVRGTGIEGLPSRPATATFQTDGAYEVTSFQPGDGLLPGRYLVSVNCIDGAPDENRSYEDISLVATGWKPDKLEVEEGQSSITWNIEVPGKK